jgi:hypothetical protein
MSEAVVNPLNVTLKESTRVSIAIAAPAVVMTTEVLVVAPHITELLPAAFTT